MQHEIGASIPPRRPRVLEDLRQPFAGRIFRAGELMVAGELVVTPRASTAGRGDRAA